MLFCWSCDELHLKWERKKKFPSLQFIKRDRMSLLSNLPPNGRSMPLSAICFKILILIYYFIKGVWNFKARVILILLHPLILGRTVRVCMELLSCALLFDEKTAEEVSKPSSQTFCQIQTYPSNNFQLLLLLWLRPSCLGFSCLTLA